MTKFIRVEFIFHQKSEALSYNSKKYVELFLTLKRYVLNKLIPPLRSVLCNVRCYIVIFQRALGDSTLESFRSDRNVWYVLNKLNIHKQNAFVVILCVKQFVKE